MHMLLLRYVFFQVIMEGDEMQFFKRNSFLILMSIYILSFSLVVFSNFDYAITSNFAKNTSVVVVEKKNVEIGKELNAVAENTDVPMFILVMEEVDNSEQYMYNYYVTDNFDLSFLKKNVPTPQNDEYVSNIKTGEENEISYLPYSNSVRKVYIHNVESLKSDDSNYRYTLQIKGNYNTSEVETEFSKLGYEVLDSKNQVVVPVSIIKNNLFFIFSMFILVVISILSFFDTRLKKLYVKKLNGYSTLTLFNESCIKFNKSYWLIAIVVYIILLILNFNTYEQFIFSAIYNFKYIVIFSIPLIVCFSFYCLIILKQSIISIIKNNKFSNLLPISFFSKFILVITLILITSSGTYNLFSEIDSRKQLESYSEIEDYYTIRQSNKASDQSSYVQLYKDTEKNNNGLFVRPDQVCGEKINDCDNMLIVNQNYLDKYPIVDSEGKVLELDLKRDNKINVLVPSSLTSQFTNGDYQRMSSLMMKDDETWLEPKPISIQDNQSLPIFDLSYGKYTQPSYENPIVFVIDDDVTDQYIESAIAGSEAYFIKASPGEIDNKLKQYDLTNNISYQQKSNRAQLTMDLYNSLVKKSLLITILGCFSLIGINGSIIGVYFTNNRKKIKVKHLNGYSLFDIHKHFLIGNQIILLLTIIFTPLINLTVMYNPIINTGYLLNIVFVVSILNCIIDMMLVTYFLNKETNDIEGY